MNRWLTDVPSHSQTFDMSLSMTCECIQWHLQQFHLFILITYEIKRHVYLSFGLHLPATIVSPVCCASSLNRKWDDDIPTALLIMFGARIPDMPLWILPSVTVNRNLRWRSSNRNYLVYTYTLVHGQDNDEISTPTPMFSGSGNMNWPVQILPDSKVSWKSKVAKCNRKSLYGYNTCNFFAILCTSWDIVISSLKAAILIFPLPISSSLVVQYWF